jgi:hypothetical protein
MHENGFYSLIQNAIQDARDGLLLGKELLESIIDQDIFTIYLNEPEKFAMVIRDLASFCEWDYFHAVQKRYEEGEDLDEILLSLRNSEEEINEYYESDEFKRSINPLIEMHKDMVGKETRFFNRTRDAEKLMGFDDEVTVELNSIFGKWDDNAVPASALDLLPNEITFPLRSNQNKLPYDHNLHLLTHKLVSFFDDGKEIDRTVLGQCGHVLAGINPNDKEAGFRFIVDQLIILADDYMRKNSSDVIALCWRGELGFWVSEDDIALDYAKLLWEKTSNSSFHEINKVLAFFALTTNSSVEWDQWGWDSFNPFSHLGDLHSRWNENDQSLAAAIIRRATQKGEWNTSLICATFHLEENGHYLESADLPSECWAWMAENIAKSRFGMELYDRRWANSFFSRNSQTNPRLIHNMIAVLLTGLLFNRPNPSESPTLQELLTVVTDVQKAGTTLHKKRAALEMVKYFQEKVKPGHLTAADRLAISNALSSSLFDNLTPVSTVSPKIGTTTNQDYPSLYESVEVILKARLTESIWAKCSATAREEFKHGEISYITAKGMEGDAGDYRPFVMAYSIGLLVHIQECIRGPFNKDRKLRYEFYKIFGEEGKPEWNELKKFITNFEIVAATAYGKRLLGQKVALRQLGELALPFEEVKKYRNRAAHSGGRIDREDAALFHALLWKKGLLEKVIRYFPLTPRR